MANPEIMTILIAADMEVTRNELRARLEPEGYNVLTVYGYEIFARVTEAKPALIIICDPMDSSTDVIQTCRILKSKEETKDIPIIIGSMHDGKRIRDSALKLGVNEYLVIPEELAKVPACVANVLRTSGAINDGLGRENLSPPSPINKSRDPYRIVGTVLASQYELVSYAGSGGMGAVYQALNRSDGSIVAVKILKPDIIARNTEYADLFEREVKNAQGLKHPHIVEVFDSGQDEGLFFMVMEWIEGKSIEDVIEQQQLPLSNIINIFEQVCSAVAYAHESKIIHLDIKPSNILLIENRHNEFVKVIDFGLSRIISKESGTTVTRFRGTHQYCAPEQFGGKVSHRSDIYSLGATLYYLLTGVIPFGASYINAKIHPNLELPEIPSVVRQRNLPSSLDLVIKKALSKDPSARQQSVKQLFEEFHEAVFASRLNKREGTTQHDVAYSGSHEQTSTGVDETTGLANDELPNMYFDRIPEGIAKKRIGVLLVLYFFITVLLSAQTRTFIIWQGRLYVKREILYSHIQESKKLRQEVIAKSQLSNSSQSPGITIHAIFDDRQRNLILKAIDELLNDPEVQKKFPNFDGLTLAQTKAVVVPLWRIESPTDREQMGITDAAFVLSKDQYREADSLVVRERPLDSEIIRIFNLTAAQYPEIDLANGTPRMTQDGTPRIFLSSNIINEDTFGKLKITLLHEFVHAHDVPGYNPGLNFIHDDLTYLPEYDAMINSLDRGAKPLEITLWIFIFVSLILTIQYAYLVGRGDNGRWFKRLQRL